MRKSKLHQLFINTRKRLPVIKSSLYTKRLKKPKKRIIPNDRT